MSLDAPPLTVILSDRLCWRNWRDDAQHPFPAAEIREELLSSLRWFLSRSLGWLAAGVRFLCKALLVAWGTLAIYYSNLPWPQARLALAIAFALFSIMLEIVSWSLRIRKR